MSTLQVYFLDKLLDCIWPRRCEICDTAMDRLHGYICSDCLNRIDFVPVRGCCRKCGRDAMGLDKEFLCQECREKKPAFDRAASAVRFSGDARNLINAYKFHNRLWLRDDFVDWLEATGRVRFNLAEIDLIVAMPISLWRRFDRGYNQCEYLARSLARRLGLKFGKGVIRRRGSPRRQGGLDEVNRRHNVVGTFKVCHPELVAEKTVLVIDDIMTTGSTLSECAAELKRAGAKRVWCLTLARSLRT